MGTATQTRHFDGSTDINREFVVVEEREIVTWLTIGCAASLCLACLCSVCLFVSCVRRKNERKGTKDIAAVLATMHSINQEVVRKNTASNASETPVHIELGTPVSTVNKVNAL